ncbi:MAG: DUF2007 domain-containing protein [Deltaproteobacteria bacterium]|nr:DUF2007 domain-containing protein [Deltaproteobacteria bacterium]
MPLERVASFTYLHEAELARALLESAGIEAHVADQHLVGLDWQMASALGGVKVLVAAEQAAAARDVLAAPPEESAAFEASDSPEPLDEAARCPKCGAEGVPANQLDRRLRAFSMLTVPLPFTIGRHRLACEACGTRWRAVPEHRGFLRALANLGALLVLALLGVLSLSLRGIGGVRAIFSRDVFACWKCGAQFASGAAACPSCGNALPGRIAYAQRVTPGRAYDGACAQCHLPYANSDYAAATERRCSSCQAALPESP